MAVRERYWREYPRSVKDSGAALLDLARRAAQILAPGFDPGEREIERRQTEEDLGEGWRCYTKTGRYGEEERGFTFEEEETITGDSYTPQPHKLVRSVTAYGLPESCALSLTIDRDGTGPLAAGVKMVGPDERVEAAERMLNDYFRVRKRTYRASDVSPEQLDKALSERRVLLVHAGSRAYGSGDVWFTIGRPADRDASRLDGIILPDPITEESLASWNDHSRDSEGEFWEFHDSIAITDPCRAMTAEQRVKFKQAVASLMAELIAMLPFTLAASAYPYLELLYLYVRDPRPELSQRVAACARQTGWTRLSFDPDQSWENDGKIEPVEPYLRKELPRTLGEYVRADRIAVNEAADVSDVWAAQGRLADNIRRWITDAAWEIYAGGCVPYPFVMLKPPAFPEARWPSLQDQEIRLRALAAGLDGEQKASFHRYCVRECARKLALCPELPAGVSKLLAMASQWAAGLKPEVQAEAHSLAAQAARIGGEALFGQPFHLMTVTEPMEIARRMAEAARAMAEREFRACTQGLYVSQGAEQRAGERAVVALLERLGRYVRKQG